MWTKFSALSCIGLVAASAFADGPVTTGSLVREMVDLAGLAKFPEPAYRTVQFSSYDRRAEAPNTPGWYANSDGFGNEPLPGFLGVLKAPDADGVGEYLMVEVNGPGAIVRGWTAAIGGELNVFLDGNEKPLYAGPANVFLLDRYAHFARQMNLHLEGVGDAFHQQDADYFPVPFAESCRIVWRGKLNEIHFYHVQVRKYAPGTAIRTFQAEDLKTYAEDIQRTISILQSPSQLLEGVSIEERVPVELTVEGGKPMEAAKIENGPGAIRKLALRVTAPDLRNALRQTILRIQFDGAPQAQVESPVGDFFGAAPGINPYESLPMTVMADGTMICRYVMPFARSMSLSFDNRGRQTVRIDGELRIAPLAWDEKDSMHFRARWRVQHDLFAAGGDAARDLPFLVAHGKGVYVGTAVMLMNPSPVPTAYGNWWGEGDEKVFVDGEMVPSTFGTGSEDYFNYSWSRCDLFDHPYCAQPIVTGPDTRGYTSNSRWQILDALPFEQEIAFYMELYSHRPTPGLSYARIAYHYARPSIRDDCVPIMDSDAKVPPLPADWRPVAKYGSTGAIFYQAESLRAVSESEVKTVGGEQWSAGKLLVWKPSGEGDKLSLSLDVEQPARYAIVITAAMTPASGSFAASCDGRALLRGGDERSINLRSAHQTMLRNFAWNPIDLKAGSHTLVLESLDSQPPDDGIGVDFIWLHPRK